MREVPRPDNRERAVLRQILARTRTARFQDYLKNLLLELCRIDTTPSADVQRMRAAEDGSFRILERELSGLKFSPSRLERRPIDPAIERHPNFSQLHFTKSAKCPQGLSAEEVYARRTNLLYHIAGSGASRPGQSVALNAHVDVVTPYFPPRARGGVVYGRGACDDKGPVVSIVAALKVLSEVMAPTGLEWRRGVVAMFVVEEETGGNGSLCLAIDHDLKRLYESVLVAECTGLKIHPANRGAVWYKAIVHPPAGVSPLEMFAFINEELEKEGAAIRAESRHELFPQRPVQTCHGIIGPFGEHPSRICGKAAFVVQFDHPPDRKTRGLVRDCLEAGLAGYIGQYGDKTKVADGANGKPMVRRHYDLAAWRDELRVNVYGAAGHMGAIRERDGAITKMAHLVRSLVYSKAKLEVAAGGPMRLELARKGSSSLRGRRQETTVVRTSSEEQEASAGLVLEGGQGFVPTHAIAEVMERLRRAVDRGAEDYLRRRGRTMKGSEVVTVTYDKLHNTAFAGNPDSSTMREALAAARACGLRQDRPVLGWTVSCDARLFATEYPAMPVLTFGPGHLVHAHADQEQIEVADVRAAAEFLALFLLLETGTL